MSTKLVTQRRSGITLLEVLISIGVLAIGLLGAALLIPIAQHKAVQGTLEDRKAMVGRRAFHEFRVRGFNRPRLWKVVSDGKFTTPIPIAPNPVQYRAYCIDPRMIANTFQAAPQVQQFPAFANLPMVRTTLRSQPPDIPGDAILTPQQADEIFTFKDDLVIEAPNRKEEPPSQSTLKVAVGGNEVPVKRAYEGQFSWMGMLVPDPILDSDMYVLSAVVFHKRLLDPTQEISISGDASVRWLGGNDVELAVDPSTHTPAQVEAFQKNMRVGNWILLGQANPQIPNDATRYRFKWVRIIAANDGDSATSRIITYAGHDWTWDLDQNPSTTGDLIPTEVTFIPGVVSVYEKSIRLEGTSVWEL